LEGQFTELKAGYSGVVSDIVSDRGVVIDVLGSLLQGVWGNGRINFGLLNLLSRTPEEVLTPGMMDISMRGAVVMGSYCEDEKVLVSGEDMPLRGMILGSMDSSLVPIAMNVSYPVLLLEGFGKLAMNQDAFNILVSGSRREVSVNAEPWSRITGTRPEAVIALPEGVQPASLADSAAFATGQSVRVISPPYKSAVGTLTTLQSGLSVLPNGLRAQTAGVRLANGDIVQVPLANLEIIG
jgi:hypothetical protein